MTRIPNREKQLQELFSTQCKQINWQVEVFQRLPSSNQYLLDLAVDSDIHQRICVVVEQTDGRARLGRKWTSIANQTVTFSLGWQCCNLPLSVLAGYALLQALHAKGVQDLALKWPNDLLFRGAKVAGILVDSRASQNVIGIGLNLGSAEILQKELAREVADLSRYQLDIDEVVVGVACQFANLLSKVQAIGMSRFVPAWEAWHALQGKSVVVRSANAVYEATVLGLEENGDLRVNYLGQNKKVSSGEVSLT